MAGFDAVHTIHDLLNPADGFRPFAIGSDEVDQVCATVLGDSNLAASNGSAFSGRSKPMSRAGSDQSIEWSANTIRMLRFQRSVS